MTFASQSEYDAVLVVSFGGPEGMADVIPFLENVLRGKNVPRERMLEVAEHYRQFSGVSPLNAQNRALVAALKIELQANGISLPVYWGNRNWHPLLPDTLRKMAADGIRRALAFVTSAYSSYSGCRQYLENIEQARITAGASAPQVDKLRAFFNHPGFIEPQIERAREALEQLPRERRNTTKLVFTAHSIPSTMAAGCAYEVQLREACRLVAEELTFDDWALAFQSRSGPPSQPWLGPDIRDWLRASKANGANDVVIVPIGFVSDHVEVIYDLDIEARGVCETLGINMVRAATVGTHPRFVRMIRELIVERIEGAAERPALGTLGASHDICESDCCLSGRRV
jgi:protoporphyrin/coproporphyrin ferrochelatase